MNYLIARADLARAIKGVAPMDHGGWQRHRRFVFCSVARSMHLYRGL